MNRTPDNFDTGPFKINPCRTPTPKRYNWLMSWLEVLILSLVEGVTEFLPISSTGHLIVASHFLGVTNEDFVVQFNVIIQFGAILSVLFLYWRRFLQGFKIYKNLVIAVLPAVILGVLVKDHIDRILNSTTIVAWAFIVGGVVLIWSDRFFDEKKTGLTVEDLSFKKSFLIGLAQCFAFIPGMSRAASAILGGLGVGLSRKEATEFSFFLAVPTLTGAMLIKLIKILPTVTSDQVSSLVSGVVLSFVFALFAIKFLIGFVSQHGFKYFGIYRIFLGVLILVI